MKRGTLGSVLVLVAAGMLLATGSAQAAGKPPGEVARSFLTITNTYPTAVCRVTGGGTLRPGITDESCTTVETTILPLVSASGVEVHHISHGGSLGAPFAQPNCGEVLGSGCIRGQWQHTRHFVGPKQAGETINANFHGTTPTGVFDSLLCTCLGCCDPKTAQFVPPVEEGVSSLCNPDDREVCGPQPRPAPANAIIFSGLGVLSSRTRGGGPNSHEKEWVVFRVYIEDRSEPGGFYPKGAIEPADVYCFHAWKTGIVATKGADFSTIAPGFRTALAESNCEFVAALRGGALPIGTLPSPEVEGILADIQDCGPLYNGNHQIHPATGASCQP